MLQIMKSVAEKMRGERFLECGQVVLMRELLCKKVLKHAEGTLLAGKL